MRKLLFFLLLAFTSFRSFSQAPTLQQKLYYTGKVWGFVKYYHSNVSVCGVDWDSVLLHVLPLVRTAATSDEFNDALDTMLAAAGPMAIATSYFPDTLAPELKRNRDWTWISATTLRADVQVQLDTIKNNFRPHAGCWVADNFSSTPAGWLTFLGDSVCLNINTATTFPNQDQRLLMLYKYWNIMRYFNPYNYVLDVDWDTTLRDHVVPVAATTTGAGLHYLFDKISTRLDDAHVEGTTYSASYQVLPGVYTPRLRLKYVGGEYVVVRSAIPGINVGEALVSVDGLTTAQWEDSLSQYISAGNPAVLHREMTWRMLGRMVNGEFVSLVLDNSGITHSLTVNCVWPNSYPSFFWDTYYPADSIATVQWTTMGCDIAYVNMENIDPSVVPALWEDIKGKSALVLDFRNYSNGIAAYLAPYIYPGPVEVVKFTEPDVLYPGTFRWYHQYMGVSGTTPYTGKIVLMMGEGTQSHLEWSCMILSARPNVIKVGSQTAGADGNITSFRIANDLYAGFTSLGTFYPNGDSTQRIGIVPDSFVTPTRAGILAGRDEVLEKAVQAAGCNLSVANQPASIPSVYIHPNPATDIITIDMKSVPASTINIALTDITGKTLQQSDIAGKTTHSFNIASLAPGMYFIKVSASGNTSAYKFIKQ